MPISLRAALLAASALTLAGPAFADDEDAPATVDAVVVTAPSAISNLTEVPNTTASITAQQIQRTLAVVTPEDALRYLPNVLIRQRHIGDTQSPVTTRTSGVGASARSLIYVDGVLISALIGNNNTSASPKWGLITPDAIARIDVLNGPFSAAFPGNAIGSVLAITTRMPSAFEARAEVQGAVQSFSKYSDADDYRTYRFAAGIGGVAGKLAGRFSYNRLDSRSQPLTYVTAVTPTVVSAAGTPVTGALPDANRLGVPIMILGSSGFEHQVQDNASGRVTLDVSPDLTLAYTFGLFLNADDSTVNSYLRTSAGAPAYAGQLNIGGRVYNIPASAFSAGVYRIDESQLAQGLSFSSHTGGAFDFDVTVTGFDYLKSRQRIAGAALPAGFAGGAGTLARLDGTNWRTLDVNGKWRPDADHTVSFGVHADRFTLDNPRYALADWRTGAPGALTANSQGRTRTAAVWAQDVWRVAPQVKLTLGARYESWKAYDGVNFSAAPPLNVRQPELEHRRLSPKAVAAWTFADGWTLKGSAAIANRFPTVSELYQAVTTGQILSVPNPRLEPERARSVELSLERRWTDGEARIALFDERIRNTLLSQAGALNGTTVNFVQNVDATHATGVEIVAQARDVLVPALEVSGWATWLTTRVDRDAAFPAAVGKRLPQLPRWRAALAATYSGVERLDLTVAARYSDRAFATLDNADSYANTYQGFEAWFSLDLNARYRLTDHVDVGLGVTNALDRKYFLFHPFPQRTVLADLKVRY